MDLETSFAELEQYGRHNNIEVVGLPNSINDKDLESKVVEIFKEIDVDVRPNEIEACHRLGRVNSNSSLPRRTIVRFVNRKTCDRAMSNKKKLQNIDKKN